MGMASFPDRDGILARLLRQIRRDINLALVPEVTSAYATYTGTTITQMLDHMIRWLETGGDPEAEGDRRELLRALGGVPADTDGQLVADFDDGGDLVRAIERHALRIDGSSPLVRQIAAVERRTLQREAEALQGAAAADEAAVAAIEVEVTPERLDAYFSSRDQFRGRRTQSIVRIPGGYSKDTFLVTTDGGSPAELVIRRDFPFGPTEQSAADEFAILENMADAGLLVARPLAAERDRSIIGEPFLVVQKMPGSNAAALFAQDPALGRSGSLELARILGRLHAIDPATTGLLERRESDPREAVRAHIAGWRQHWLRNRVHPSALAEAAFAWLNENVPLDIPRLVLVHADARPDNMLIENGKLSALLDWEFTHVGDPAEDLEYTRLFVEPLVDWGEFIQAYLAAGGVRVSDDGSRFYEVWRSLRNFVCCDVSWGGFVTDRYPVIKLSAQGVSTPG